MVVIHDHPATAAAQTLLSQEKRILRDAADQAWQQPVRRKTEYANLQAVRAAQSSGRQNLERFERALRFLFDECGVRLGYLQLKFLHAARTVLLKRMFGTGIVSEQSYLQAKFQIKRLYDTCSIIFPRRSGKTTVQTILAAVLAVSQPDGNYVAFNLTGRQSKAWLNQSIKWMELFQKSPEFRYVELQRDMRESLMIRNCCGTTARIASFAGGTTTTGGSAGNSLRGMGERIMCMGLDEFFFMVPSLYASILPLLANGAAMILTSSMSTKADDEIQRMLKARMPDGREIVMQLDWIRACAKCTVEGIGDRCTHLKQRPQHFQRSVDQERLKALMKPFGDDAFEREMLNVAARSSLTPVFEHKWLEPLRKRECDYQNTLGIEHRYFFVAIDPAGNGFSQTVLISILPVDNPGSPVYPLQFVITGGEVIPSRATEDITEGIIKHIRAVRHRVPGMSLASAVVIIESNLPLLAESIKRAIYQQAVTHCVVMHEDRKRARPGGVMGEVRAGTRTSNETKGQQVAAMREAFGFRAVRFHAQFVVAQPEKQPQDEAHPRDNIITELANFKEEVRLRNVSKANKPYTQTVLLYSGRHAGGGRARDDYVMAFGFVLLLYTVFISAPEYRAYR